VDAPILTLRPGPIRLRAARRTRLIAAGAVLVAGVVLFAVAPLARQQWIWFQEAGALGVLWSLYLIWLGLSLRPVIEVGAAAVRRRIRLRWRSIPRSSLVEAVGCTYLTPTSGRARYAILRDGSGRVALSLRIGLWSDEDVIRLRSALDLGEDGLEFEERSLRRLAGEYPGVLPFWHVHPNLVGALGGVALTLLVALGVVLSGQASPR
jgi:hypothetical protein